MQRCVTPQHVTCDCVTGEAQKCDDDIDEQNWIQFTKASNGDSKDLFYANFRILEYILEDPIRFSKSHFLIHNLKIMVNYMKEIDVGYSLNESETIVSKQTLQVSEIPSFMIVLRRMLKQYKLNVFKEYSWRKLLRENDLNFDKAISKANDIRLVHKNDVLSRQNCPLYFPCSVGGETDTFIKLSLECSSLSTCNSFPVANHNLTIRDF